MKFFFKHLHHHKTNKKFLLVLLLLGTVLFLHKEELNAQVVKGGVIAGFNKSKVDGDEVDNAAFGYTKWGVNAGVVGILPIGEKFSLSLETLFSQKGSFTKRNFTYYDSVFASYKLVLDYVEVPVLFHYIDKKFLHIGTGISYGQLVRFEEYEYGEKINWTQETRPYKSHDISWIADLYVPLTKRLNNLKINLRYSYALQSIRTRKYTNKYGDTWSRDQYNAYFAVRLMYIFNEPESPNLK